MKQLIAPGTAADTAEVRLAAGMKATISAGKLAGAEVVTFQLLEDGVGTPGDLYQDTVQRQLTATSNATIVEGPIDIQVSKGVTALAVGVYIKA